VRFLFVPVEGTMVALDPSDRRGHIGAVPKHECTG
jgi:hypothetical protein